MTKISNFGKQSSILGSVVPLAMFISRGVTHGDELIYLFSAGVFDLTFLDWEIARVITNLWANFVIHG